MISLLILFMMLVMITLNLVIIIKFIEKDKVRAIESIFNHDPAKGIIFIHLSGTKNQEYINIVLKRYEGERLSIVYSGAPPWKAQLLNKKYDSVQIISDQDGKIARKMGVTTFPSLFKINFLSGEIKEWQVEEEKDESFSNGM